MDQSPLIFRSASLIAVRYTNWSTIFVLQCSRKKRGYGKGQNFSRVQSNRIRWIRRFEVWKSDYHRVENFCILYEWSFIYSNNTVYSNTVYESTTEIRLFAGRWSFPSLNERGNFILMQGMQVFLFEQNFEEERWNFKWIKLQIFC